MPRYAHEMKKSYTAMPLLSAEWIQRVNMRKRILRGITIVRFKVKYRKTCLMKAQRNKKRKVTLRMPNVDARTFTVMMLMRRDPPLLSAEATNS